MERFIIGRLRLLQNIDKALLRKGRLIAEYEFNELDVNKSNKLLKKINIDQDQLFRLFF